MPRPQRIEYENAFYHIMNRGRERKAIFHGEVYCLTGNHHHLLLETPDVNLSRIMQHVDGLYTQRYNRLKKTDGS